MYTECPHCHAIFRVTQAILQAAGGKVRCGECGTVFQAVKPAARQQASTGTPAEQAPPSRTAEKKPKPEAPREQKTRIDRRGAAPSGPVASTASFHREARPAAPKAPDAPPEEARETNDGFRPETDFVPKYLPVSVAPPKTPPARRHGFLKAVLVALLTALLIGQVLLANRKALGASPVFRPIVTGLCKVAGCHVPEHRDLNAIKLLNHGVYSHPTVPGALMIKAVIENDADFEQPYPVIELAFSNIQGKRIAMRRFGPSEYLDLRTEHPPLMPVGKPVQVRLEIVDPGKDALAFDFEFR